MDTQILISNITNPTLLFFLLGVIAALVKSDLEIPPGSVKFISLYLLFSIGFKGGQELAHSGLTTEIIITLIVALTLAALVPLYSFFILKRKLNVYDAGAVAAAYGSVSAVTFVAASGFLEATQVHYGGHMVAAMAMMEAPAIIIGVMLIRKFDEHKEKHQSMRYIVHDALTNGSVLMIMGSLIIGIVADTKQAEGIKPFTSDIFKGFLAVFLLDMGMVAAKRFKAFRSYGWFVTLFGLLMPPFNALLSILITSLFHIEPGNRFLIAILAASASYIAVPAAMRLAAPKADPGLYIPMALGVTFPLNITIGIPLYWWLVNNF
ncbi:MAG: sodium-dependent bicarbonate transport family permease [Chitinophagaceae bacterium]|nr:sodium-dependent bicarbonate transport family permease [Chitinophagaceae bacterium]